MMIICDLKVDNDGSILISPDLIKSLNLNSDDQVTVYLDKYRGREIEPELLEALVHEGIILEFSD